MLFAPALTVALPLPLELCLLLRLLLLRAGFCSHFLYFTVVGPFLGLRALRLRTAVPRDEEAVEEMDDEDGE